MKKQFNYFYSKFILICFSLFILAFVVFYEKNDLFKLPFNSGVWGTASDWIMISVTLGTAYWLVRTFREQKRSNDILESKSRRDVLPIFIVSKNAKPSTYSLNAIYIEISLTSNRAYFPEILLTDLVGEVKFPDDQVAVDERLPVWLNRERLEEISSKSLAMTLYFSDIDGRRYVQIIWWGNNEFTIDWPYLLDQSEELSFFQELERYIKSRFSKKIKKEDLPF